MSEVAEALTVYLLLLFVSIVVSLVLAVRCPSQYLSDAGNTLFIAVLGGLVVKVLSSMFDSPYWASVVFSFDSPVLFNVLLPPIIFKSGYEIQGLFFWANVDKILWLAFAGTLVSSVVVGYILYACRGVLGWDDVQLSEFLSFGALISATDPVTTLAIFEQLRVDPHLFNVVFGESVLNDAVAIVLFRIFSKFIGYSGDVTFSVVATGVGDFTWIFVGSAVVGFVSGVVSALLFKAVLGNHTHLANAVTLELALYGPYLVAESVELSGIVSILFTGITMKHYAEPNLTEKCKEMVEEVVTLLAHVTEALIFVDLGTSAPAADFKKYAGITVVAMLACIVGRIVHVYPIGLMLNKASCINIKKFEMAHQHMVCFSGLRGAIAYALAASFPGKHRELFASTTMAIVLFTVWVFGGLTVPTLRYLRIEIGASTEDAAQDLREQAVHRRRLSLLDSQYVMPKLVRGRQGGSPGDAGVELGGAAGVVAASSGAAAVAPETEIVGGGSFASCSEVPLSANLP